MPELELSVSATTRRPRPGETHGVDYHFLDDAEFDRRVRGGEFVEHANYSGRRYGTLRSDLDQRLARGAPVVLEIEVQGARQIAETMPEAVRIFIAPPSEDALRDAADRPRHRLARGRREAARTSSEPSCGRRGNSRTSSSTTGSRMRWSPSRSSCARR